MLREPLWPGIRRVGHPSPPNGAHIRNMWLITIAVERNFHGFAAISSGLIRSSYNQFLFARSSVAAWLVGTGIKKSGAFLPTGSYYGV